MTGNQRQSKKLLAEHFEGLEDEEEEDAGAEEEQDDEAEGSAGSEGDLDDSPDQHSKVSA